MSEEKISQVKNMYCWCNNNDSYLRTLIKFTYTQQNQKFVKTKTVFWDKERGSSDNVFYIMPQAFILFFT